jgi:uncharacterized protein YggE
MDAFITIVVALGIGWICGAQFEAWNRRKHDNAARRRQRAAAAQKAKQFGSAMFTNEQWVEVKGQSPKEQS